MVEVASRGSFLSKKPQKVPLSDSSLKIAEFHDIHTNDNDDFIITQTYPFSAKLLNHTTFDDSDRFCASTEYESNALIDTLSNISFSPESQENESLNSSQLDDASSTSTSLAGTQTDSLDYNHDEPVANFGAIPPSRLVAIEHAFLDSGTGTKLMSNGIRLTDSLLVDVNHRHPTETTCYDIHAGYSKIETCSVYEIAQRRIFEEATEDAFYIADLGTIIRQHQQWKQLLPRVEPFYAVKCNSDPMILKTLYDLGTGFDCASRSEIDTVMSLGSSSHDIIYANPCKQASHIRHARDRGVNLMTFDNANELIKIKEINPNAKLVLRVLTDDSRSLCRFGVKFGARPGTTLCLLRLARDLGIEVVGVSFHVGSGCFDKMAFVDAVRVARGVFDEGASLGMNFTLLDIGGGFPGLGAASKISFPEIAQVLGPAIDDYFPPEVRVIAEPGRYYASGTYTLCVSVTSRRVIPHDLSLLNASFPDESDNGISRKNLLLHPKDHENHASFMYYVNDGVYGSFNCLFFDHVTPNPNILTSNGRLVSPDEFLDRTSSTQFESSLWGPTCDSIDCISKKLYLPELHIGDWLSFENMGAYTIAAASTFNGFARSSVVYTNTELSF